MEDGSIVAIWKPFGWTPLMAAIAYKKLNPQYVKETISYAGRLDPMAEGVLLLLIGSKNKQRKQYELLPKSYEAEFILGITTDSSDALGLITSCSLQQRNKETIQEVLIQFLGKQSQFYPVYSSRTIRGKPLYWWARNNRLKEISIPRKNIEISTIKLIGVTTMSTSQLYNSVSEKIHNVTGDFRQKEILAAWKNFEKSHAEQPLTRVKIEVSCSTGTYIRQLVSDIGDKLGCGSFTLSITRTRVGEYTIKQCLLHLASNT